MAYIVDRLVICDAFREPDKLPRKVLLLRSQGAAFSRGHALETPGRQICYEWPEEQSGPSNVEIVDYH